MTASSTSGGDEDDERIISIWACFKFYKHKGAGFELAATL